MTDFVVKHYLHDGTAVGETNPITPEWGFKLDDADYLNYEIPTNISLATAGYTFPYLTDWTLFRNGKELMAGIHTPVNITENPGDTLKVSGLGWLHYFQRRFYPFDPTNPTAYFYAVVQRNAFLVVQDIFTTVLAQPYSLTGITFNHGFAYVGTDPPLINYNIDPGDTGDMLSKLQDLSKLVPFDFEITWDKKINLYYPTRGSTTQVMQIPLNLEVSQYTNNGPDGNSLLGIGASSGQSQLGVLIQDTDSMGAFRRLDYTKNFGNTTDLTMLTQQGNQDIKISAHPVLPITATVHVDAWPTFWDDVHVGDYAPVTVDYGYTVVDEILRIVQIIGKVDTEGHETADLSFNTQ